MDLLTSFVKKYYIVAILAILGLDFVCRKLDFFRNFNLQDWYNFFGIFGSIGSATAFVTIFFVYKTLIAQNRTNQLVIQSWKYQFLQAEIEKLEKKYKDNDSLFKAVKSKFIKLSLYENLGIDKKTEQPYTQVVITEDEINRLIAIVDIFENCILVSKELSNMGISFNTAENLFNRSYKLGIQDIVSYLNDASYHVPPNLKFAVKCYIMKVYKINRMLEHKF
jgi:hypothetical protein